MYCRLWSKKGIIWVVPRLLFRILQIMVWRGRKSFNIFSVCSANRMRNWNRRYQTSFLLYSKNSYFLNFISMLNKCKKHRVNSILKSVKNGCISHSMNYFILCSTFRSVQIPPRTTEWERRGLTMDLRSAARGFLAFLLSVPGWFI